MKFAGLKIKKAIVAVVVTSVVVLVFFSCAREKALPDSEEIHQKNDEYELLKRQGYSEENPFILATGLDPGEFIQWTQDPANGHYKETKMEELTFSVTHKPADYIICMEQKSELIPMNVSQQRKEELKGLEQYEIKIALNEGSGELLKHQLGSVAEYSDRVNYFAFKMQKDITMQTDKGEIVPCTLFHFERTYDVVPYCKFLIGFKPTEGSTKTIVFRDKTFGKGTLQFLFFEKDLMTQPLLNTSL
jgi:hypothetical protein